jgi:ABC-2 type transport system permease protein
LYAFVAKQLKVKYKRSVLGFLWSFLLPILLTGVYLFVFIYVYKVPKRDFVLFLLSGLLPWQFFNTAILATTSTFVENGSLIRKVYFPRIFLPISAVLANFVTFLAGLCILEVILILRGEPVWSQLHWLVLAMLLQVALAIACGTILGTGNVYFRDIAQLVSILLTVLFFATPIVYELNQVPEAFRPVILANPLSGIMEIYRAAFLQSSPPEPQVIGLAVVETAVLLAVAYVLFRKMSPEMAKEL